jgi:hypothetical protein
MQKQRYLFLHSSPSDVFEDGGLATDTFDPAEFTFAPTTMMIAATATASGTIITQFSSFI